MHKKLGNRREKEDSEVFGISLNKYHEDCTGQIMICANGVPNLAG